MRLAKLRPRRLLLLGGFSLLVFLLAYFSPVSNEGSDPHFSLIVSQAIVQEGTIRLDHYHESAPHLFDAFFWQPVQLNGHYYYNYPIGPSLFAVPFVAVANLLGKDMLVIGHNHALQNLISALLCALIFILLFLVVYNYLTYRAAFAVSAISMLGSAFISTLGTAYWNMNVAVLFILLTLYLITAFDSGRRKGVAPFFLAILLFAAFLTRPSAAIFILVTFVFLLFKERSALLRTAGAALFLLLGFLLFSRLEYGRWLPVYYSANTWYNPQGLLLPLYGVTFSPSRGLFIYSPFFLATVAAGVSYAGRLKRSLLFWLCSLWLLLQLVSVAITRQWYGGFSFGPRLLTEAMAALVVMTAILWHTVGRDVGRRTRNLSATVFVLLGVIGILINSVQGLFNVRTALWNAFPSVDEHPELLFDWQYPQFLTTTTSFHERRLHLHSQWLARGEERLQPYSWASELRPTYQVDRAFFGGWWQTQTGKWWTELEKVTILLAVPEVEESQRFILELHASALSPQEVVISVNRQEVGTLHIREQPHTEVLQFDGAALQPGQINRISLYLPQSSHPSHEQLRNLDLSFALHRLGLTEMVLRIVPRALEPDAAGASTN